MAVACALAVAGSAAADKGPVTAPPPPQLAPLAVDLSGVPEIFPNGSVSGTLGAGSPRFFKVFANRSDAAPETLAVTLEATGSLFGAGSLSLYDPEQVILDELFTNTPGDLRVSRSIVPETGYYLIVVASDASYTWAVTVNWSAGTAFPSDNDNDLSNATVLSGDSGSNASSVADWGDLVDLYAIDLAVSPPLAEALLVNLTSPNIADLDVHIYHIVNGTAVIDGLSISPFGTEYAAALPPLSGRYYIHVMSYQGSSPYTMGWARLTVNADDNGLPPTATPLPAGNFANNLSRWDMRDLFVFDLPANTTLNVSLHTEGYNATARTPDLQAVLWDAAFNRVTWSFAFDPDERIDALLPATGIYYLDIFNADPSYYLTSALSFNYTMTVSIDRPPALVPPDWNRTQAEDSVAVLNLTSVVPEDPVGEPLSFTVAGTMGGITASIGANGRTLTVTPDPDWFGAASVTVVAADRWQAVTIVLPFAFTPVNDPPRLVQGAGTLGFDEDGAGLIDVSVSVIDPEGNVWSLMNASAAAPIQVLVAGTVVTVRAAADYAGTGTVTLVAQDEFGALATLSVAVVVEPVNDPPRFLRVPGPFNLTEDASAQEATFSLSGVAADPDGDAVTFALTGPAQLAAIVVGTNLSIVPGADFAGSLTAMLVASDGSASASVQVTVRVAPVNDAPRIAPASGPLVAREGAAFSYEVQASDIDSPLDDLRFAFGVDGEAAGAFQESAAFERTFSFESAGYHVLRVTVSDGNLTTAAEFTVFVAQTNRPPDARILSPAGAKIAQGALVSFTAHTTDPDGDSVNVTWVVDGTPASNSPTFSLDRLPAGKHTVQLLVFDGEFSSTDEAQFEVAGGLPGLDGPLAALALVGAAALAISARRAPGRSANAPKKLK